MGRSRKHERRTNAIDSIIAAATSGSSASEEYFPELRGYDFSIPIELSKDEYERKLEVDLVKKGYDYSNRYIDHIILQKEAKERISGVIDLLVLRIRKEIGKIYEGFPSCYIFTSYKKADDWSYERTMNIINPDLCKITAEASKKRSRVPPETEVDFNGKKVKLKEFQISEDRGHIETLCLSIRFDFKLSHDERISKIQDMLSYYSYLGAYSLNKTELKKILNELEEGKRARRVGEMLKRARKMPEYSGLETWISAELPDTAKALAREMM